MWRIVQEAIPILLVVLVLSQYVLPTVFNTEKWWLFKRTKKKVSTVVNPTTLSEEIKSTQIVVEETKSKVDKVAEKVEENLKSAEDLKKEVENLKK